ncbi:heme NO-binding domain-containing protein [Kineococcus terrestris]|uniref:heme NO-binding domain-containing protein n=1 Tax=Kineococcus terrestris TaxID=2044856 RepID=UPI0034DAF322
MYGLVNTAVADLARAVGGEEAWQEVCAHAQVPPVAFVGTAAYPDDVTYRLVEGASAVLGMSPEQVLAAFGRHWVRYTSQRGWGPLLQSAGGSLPEVLAGLDALHARVRLMMPELRPPSFRCVELSATTLRLDYWSERPGLAPMVVGLVEGLAELLGGSASATHVRVAADRHDHDSFAVTHSPAPA